MSGLALIGPARVNAVVQSERNFQIFFLIAIVIAEEKTEAAVLILEPPFKSACNALTGIVQRLQRQALRL